MQDNSIIFHMCAKIEWQTALVNGFYKGSAQDVVDGFIHFSTTDQLSESAYKHRKGQRGLVLLSVEVDLLGEALRWERSREGDLFPHLYGPLSLQAVICVDALELGKEGRHKFPERLFI